MAPKPPPPLTSACGVNLIFLHESAQFKILILFIILYHKFSLNLFDKNILLKKLIFCITTYKVEFYQKIPHLFLTSIQVIQLPWQQ